VSEPIGPNSRPTVAPDKTKPPIGLIGDGAVLVDRLL
jgi:hypothetical protein